MKTKLNILVILALLAALLGGTASTVAAQETNYISWSPAAPQEGGGWVSFTTTYPGTYVTKKWERSTNPGGTACDQEIGWDDKQSEFWQSGDYLICLTIYPTWNFEDAISYTQVMTVTNLPPEITHIYSGNRGGLYYSVTADARDWDSGITCTVDYGDGTGPLAGEYSGYYCYGPDHEFPAEGTYDVVVTLNEPGFDPVSTTYQLNVVNNDYHVFTWTPASPVVGEDVTFSLKAGDPPPEYSLLWTRSSVPGGTVCDATIGTEASPIASFASAGDYKVCLVMSNYGEPIYYDSQVVTVTQAEASFSVGPISVVEYNGSGDPITTSPVGTLLEITAQITGYNVSMGCFFDYGDGTTYDGGVEEGGETGWMCSGTHLYTTPGIHTITITVHNSSYSEIVNVTTTNTATYIDVSFGEAPLIVIDPVQQVLAEPSLTNQKVVVFGAFTDAQTYYSTQSCEVDYGDGGEAEAGTLGEGWPPYCMGPEHVYTTPGVYTITMTLNGYNSSVATNSISHLVQQPILEQLPNHAYGSPADLDYCTNGENAGCRMAENFVVPAGGTRTIGQVQLWGGFINESTGSSSHPDEALFTVIFYRLDETTGLPGQALYTDAELIPMPFKTGELIGGSVDEFMITLTLPTHTLEAGSYWVEVQEANEPYPNVFFWETGYPDSYGLGQSGVAGYLMYVDPGDPRLPGWNFVDDPDSPFNMALRLLPPAPASSYSISGTVFDDANANGAFDTGETGMSGVSVGLAKGGDWANMTETTTGSDGSYTFSGLEAGQSYSLNVNPLAGYKVSLYPSSIPSLDADVTGMDFGLTTQPLFTWTPAAPDEGGSATFTAVSRFTNYAWKITDPGLDCGNASWTPPTAIGQTADLSFGGSSQYQVCLRMENPFSAFVYEGQLVTITNLAPVSLGAGITPEPSVAGQPITDAWASFSDVDHLAACTVNYGDGTPLETGIIPSDENSCDGPAHTYASAGTYTVTFTVTDPQGATGTATVDHVVTAPPSSADLSLTKIDSKDPIKPGASLVYTLTVKNLGSNTAESLVLTDKLDVNTTYGSVSAPRGWTCKYASNSGTVTCTAPSLASGSSAVIKITVTVSKTAKVGRDLVNNATVSSVTYDPYMTNNTVTQKTRVAK